MAKRVKIINGANLNLLGKRQPEIYGSETLASIEENCQKFGKQLNLACQFYHSNIEGELVNYIQESLENTTAIIINAGAYTHTSIAIYDALCMFSGIVIEVHISNIFAREEYRHYSYISPRADGIIVGCGVKGYELALRQVANLLSK